jgi:hypothetical protein
MTLVDRFASGLTARAGSRSRVYPEDIWDVFTQLRPDDARASDARQRLADLIEQATDRRLLTPSATTDHIVPVPLPQFVTVVHDRPSSASPPDAPWLPQLSWAAGLRLNPVQRDVLDRVNRWLRDSDTHRAVVPAEERSIELFDDEKAIANRIGGATTLWRPDRLGPGLLRYENVPIPFPYRHVGTGSRLLMVENTAAFRTCSRLLAAGADHHPYFAVAFGQGTWAPKTIPAALELPRPVRAVDYWGDLDPNGLAITRDLIHAAAVTGLAAQAHPTLWRLMLAHQPVPHPSARRTPDPSLVTVLPNDLRTRAQAVIDNCSRIPQERVGYDELSSTSRWWDPADEQR